MKPGNILYSLLILLLPLSIHAQHPHGVETENITKTIVQLFEGMKKGDSTLVKNAFTAEVTLATVFRNKRGELVFHRESSLADFLKTVGTPHKEVWHEEFWDLQIKVDGDFAQAWCEYAFYVDNTFSHCGIDAFHLVKEQSGWKIFHLADTRRKEGCEIPTEIRQKHGG